MYELKFKVWDTVEKRMFTWDEVRAKLLADSILYERPFIHELFMSRERYVILLSTALHDKNSKEIHVGDVVEDRFDNGNYERRIVRIYNDPLGVNLASGHTKEIIGNIYEHPELLNK